MFLLFTSCLPNKFDSTVGSPSSQHPILPTLQHPRPYPACLPTLSTRSQLCRTARDQSCPGVPAPASHCRVTVSKGEPMAGHYTCTKTSCCNVPILVLGNNKPVLKPITPLQSWLRLNTGSWETGFLWVCGSGERCWLQVIHPNLISLLVSAPLSVSWPLTASPQDDEPRGCFSPPSVPWWSGILGKSHPSSAVATHIPPTLQPGAACLPACPQPQPL